MNEDLIRRLENAAITSCYEINQDEVNLLLREAADALKQERPYFRVKRLSDNLYSKGGSTPIFSKAGKTWNSKGAFSNHLAQLINTYYSDNYIKILNVYDGCVLETNVNNLGTIDEILMQKALKFKSNEPNRQIIKVSKF